MKREKCVNLVFAKGSGQRSDFIQADRMNSGGWVISDQVLIEGMSYFNHRRDEPAGIHSPSINGSLITGNLLNPITREFVHV